MQLTLPWWRKVRYAAIPKEARDIFERFGEFVIASVVTSGMGQRINDLNRIYEDKDDMLKHAAAWLTERGDMRELHEQRLETVEWAILIFLVVGVCADVAIALGWAAHR